MKAKKILAVVVALALCMSALSVAAFAAASTTATDSPVVPTQADPTYGDPYVLPNYTPFIDFTNWTATDLDATELKNTGTSFSVNEAGLLVLTTGENAAGGFCNVVKFGDSEAPGVINSYKETGFSAPSNSTADGLCFYVDASEWTSPLTESGTEKIRFLMNDADFNEDGSARVKAGAAQNSTWCFTATFEAGFKGWVRIPFADHELFWGSEDANGYVDLANIGNFWFYLDGSGMAANSTLKIGKFGFYGVSFGTEKVLNYANANEELPNSVNLIDFTNWNDSDIAATELTSIPEFSYSINTDGLLVMAAGENGSGGFAKVVKWGDSEAPGVINSYKETGFSAPSNSIADGLYFYVDASQWTSAKTATGTETIKFLMNDADFNEDGSARVKAGAAQNTTWCFTATFPAGYKGYVKVPFANHELFWGSEDANGYVDLANIGNIWFYFDGTTIEPGTSLSIGKIGFYGPSFGASNVEVPTDFLPNYTSILDFKDWGDLLADEDKTPCGEWAASSSGEFAVSIDKNGLFTAKAVGAEAWGCRVMWLQDDDCNPLPGVTNQKGALVESTSTENGFCMYIDATCFKTNKSFGVETLTFILRDGDLDADGNVVTNKGLESTTHYAFNVSVPAGFKGWVKVPFAEAYKEFWQMSDVNGKIDLNSLKAFWLNCNGFNFAADSEIKIGKIGVYGPAFATEEEPGQDDPGKKDDEKKENPDTGVNAATGIASGLAIAALAVAAAATLRKKND